MRTKSIAILMACVVLLVATVPVLKAGAQGPTPSDDEVNAIAKQLYCPVCPNETLDTCTTVACAQWRETIREQLAMGWNAEQIMQYFAEQYGDRVLSTPPPRGLNLLLWVLPILAFPLGLFVLVRAMLKWSRSTQTSQPIASDSADPYVERVEEELRKRQ